MPDLDLDLNSLGLRTVGRAPKLTHALGAEITEADLPELTQDKGSRPAQLVKLRERHHALARGIAEGMSPQECSAVYGYSSSRISILQKDTAFAELVTYYRGEVKERYVTGHTVMSDLHLDSAEEIRERLEEEPENFSTGQLIELMKVTADRTGHGPSTQTNVDIRVGLGDRMQRAAQRVAAARMVDVTPESSDE